MPIQCGCSLGKKISLLSNMHCVAKAAFGLLFILIFFGCREGRGTLTLSNQKILDSVPSGSALAMSNQFLYIVSDDGTGVYKLDTINYAVQKIAIAGLSYEAYRQAKSVKHDFEAASIVELGGKPYLMALGSGGTAYRDSMLLLNIFNNLDQRMISVRQFYKELQVLTNTDSLRWNIEGATLAGDELILLNRGNNLLISCTLKEFISYLNGDASFPKTKFKKIQLPSIKGHEARLSGVCTINEDMLLVCASVEDTPDWISDGPVLGSYFGIYSLKDEQLTNAFLLTDEKGGPLLQKIESVEILEKTSAGDYIFLAVADNDDGRSTLFWLQLSNKQ